MRKWLIVGAMAAALVTGASVALARTEVVPVEAKFTGVIHPGFATGEGTFSPFTAVDSSGRVVLLGGTYQDTAFPAGETIHVTRALTPDGGNGEVVIRFIATLTATGAEGTWNVISSSGDYAGVKGTGTFEATVTGETAEGGLSVEESLEGQLTAKTSR